MGWHRLIRLVPDHEKDLDCRFYPDSSCAGEWGGSIGEWIKEEYSTAADPSDQEYLGLRTLHYWSCTNRRKEERTWWVCDKHHILMSQAVIEEEYDYRDADDMLEVLRRQSEGRTERHVGQTGP